MSNPLYFVGLDVGGTGMKAGLVDDTGRKLGAGGLPTEPEKGQEHGLKRMCETIRLAVDNAGLQMSQVSAVGVATPGTMDIPAGLILDPPNLKPWKNVPVRQYVHDTFRVPTAFQNDANAAAYGEFWVGAGKGVHSMVLFTLGTGVGGGIIIGDLVVEGEHSHGAEVGHTRIDPHSTRQCGCGLRGCLEAYVGGPGIVKRTHEALAQDGGKSSLHALVRDRREITPKEIFAAAAAGDALADKIVDETAFYLAVATANLMHVIDPDMVVYTGGMIAAGNAFLDRIRRHVKELALPVPAAKTQIRFAELGSDAGLIGAAGCARLLYKKLAKG